MIEFKRVIPKEKIKLDLIHPPNLIIRQYTYRCEFCDSNIEVNEPMHEGSDQYYYHEGCIDMVNKEGKYEKVE